MSVVKSFSVGNGDMFYIEHNSSNFSIIDCCYDNDKDFANDLDEISKKANSKEIVRFISTHPDEDHIKGLIELDNKLKIQNFYCVKNEARKEVITDDFKRYCSFRDDNNKAFYMYTGCKRKWMNESDEKRGSSGINVLWPKVDNKEFIKVLDDVKNNNTNYNNLSPTLMYSIEGGTRFMWMGDIETEFLDKIKEEVDWKRIDVLFAPHHGRKSGKIPECVLKKLNPKLIIVGEAPSEDLDYYQGYNTITQNTAKDITFVCEDDLISIYVENPNYHDCSFLKDCNLDNLSNAYYVGSIEVEEK